MRGSRIVVRGPVLALLLLLTTASLAQAQATLTTDKQNYAPGETVHVTGAGWIPGETVTLDFYKNDIQTPQATFRETATPAGTIQNDGFTIGPADTNSGFFVEAKGEQSGLQVHASFLDGSILTALSVGAQSPSSPLYGGQSAQYGINVSCSTSWYWFTCTPRCGSATLSVSGLPPGVSAQFSPQAPSFGGSFMCWSPPTVQAQSTLTLSVSSWAPAGTYPFTVSATGCGDQIAASGTIVLGVCNHPPNIDYITDRAIEEGTDLALTVHATDQEQPHQILHYSLEGSPPSGASIDMSSGVLSWVPSEAQGPGDYPFTVRVWDNGSPTMSSWASFYVHVMEVNRPPDLGYSLPDRIIAECQPFTATVHATDPDLPANRLSYWLAPGAPAGLQIDRSSGVLTWTPTEEQGPLTCAVTIGVTDDGWPRLEAQRTCTFTVQEVNLPPAIDLPPMVAVHEGETASFQALASDPDLPANVLTFSLVDPAPANARIDPTTGVVTWPTMDDGATPFHVAVADGQGGMAAGDVTVTTLNVAPSASITGPTAGCLVSVGTPLRLTGSFSDPGTCDTHTAEWTLDAIHVAGTVDEAAHTVQGSVTFAAAGVYALRLTVTDDDGGIGQAAQVGGVDATVVVYDPRAGFATGGGWIVSPPGAYAADPALAGRANFGFVSRYDRGANVPTGETEFRFQLAGLDFHGATYDWMVVAGTRAQFKGQGTINGAGSYGFLLTAIDGDLGDGTSADRFRIKITDRATDALVYDNQAGAADGADPATLLAGGAIVIHVNSGSNRLAGTLPSSGATAGTLPEAFALFANRPNPFRDGTAIGFAMPRPGRVELVVVDVAGRVVSTLAREERPAGWYEVPWPGERDDGRRAPSGAYFCRLTVVPDGGGAPFRAMQRMILIR